MQSSLNAPGDKYISHSLVAHRGHEAINNKALEFVFDQMSMTETRQTVAKGLGTDDGDDAGPLHV